MVTTLLSVYRVLSVRSGPVSGVRVFLQKCPREATQDSGGLPLDPKWSLLGGPFQEVHLDRMEGRNFINKMELLMASLNTGLGDGGTSGTAT